MTPILYYSYHTKPTEQEFFVSTQTKIVVKLLNTYNKLFYWSLNQSNIALMITNVYGTIIESAKVLYHWKTEQKPTFLLTTCPKQKFDAPNKWFLNI